MTAKFNESQSGQTGTTAGNTKRAHIGKSNNVIFISVIIASMVVTISLVSLSFLFKQYQYNQKVINAENKTVKTLESNLVSVENLKTTRSSLNTSSMSEQRILNAMPVSFDYPALASAMDKLASDSKVNLQGSIGSDTSVSSQPPSNNPQSVQIPLTLQVSGNYSNIKKYIKNLELSIRPISVQSITLSGTNSTMQANIVAVTYYQPSKVLSTGIMETK